jgi:glutamate carboxypeptidase
MTQLERDVCAHLATRKSAMVELLANIVNISSQSRDSEGVGAVIDRIDDFLRPCGIGTEVFSNPAYGKCLRANLDPGAASSPVVLMGHCDTVFPKAEVARRPFSLTQGRAYGPGVADMKGGVVLNAFVLEALARGGDMGCPVVGLFTADEEIASPWSRTIILETCQGASAVLNSEATRANGNFVSARKGGVFFRLEIEGKAAHSGANFAAGVSAVTEAASKVLAISGLTNLDHGITANPGAIGGGQAFNIVAASAFIEAEVRYRSLADRDRLRAEIDRIATESRVGGVKTKLIVHGEFPPMEDSAASRALQETYSLAAAAVGIETHGEFSGGCSDAGFSASAGIPTLCGVGPVGGLAHTEDEYLEVDTLVPRAQALAMTILRTIG